MQEIETYEDVVNGQVVLVKVYSPQKDLRYLFEWSHESSTESCTGFKKNYIDSDDFE